MVLHLHPVGQGDPARAVGQQTSDAASPAGCHAGQGVATCTPQLDDLVVLAAVDVDDVLRFFLSELDADVALPTLKRVPELACSGHVAKAKDARLAYEALHLVSLGDLAFVNLRGELGIHIPPLTEPLHEVGLPGEVGHHACFDLAAVTADDLVPFGCTQRPTDGIVAPARQVLEVHLVATREAPSVGTVVVEHDGQPTTVSRLDQATGTRLFQGRL